MNKFKVVARAPSNIAIVKYMGKKEGNIPENASLSMTLNDLCSFAEIERISKNGIASDIRWLPEMPTSASQVVLSAGIECKVPDLNEAGVNRVIKHVERVFNAAAEILPQYGMSVLSRDSFSFILRTANTFPPSSGIASSASAFAAITLATAAASAKDPAEFEKTWTAEKELRNALARISRQGSGSSCRSFAGPWIKWEGSSVIEVNSNMPKMTDFVLLVSKNAKAVSSSDAHKLVKSSPLWSGRIDRANQRVAALEKAIACGDIASVAKIAWADAWDMHSLFHTCEEPFSYWAPETVEILNWVKDFITSTSGTSGLSLTGVPIVTMDAGPNVHIIVESAKADRWRAILKERFSHIPFLEDTQGAGARLASIPQ